MQKNPFPDESLKEGLKARAKDRVYSFLLADEMVRGAFIHGTRMINEMRANFELGILETLALGHGYLACGLLSSTLKGNDRLSLTITCDGPIKGLVVETNAFGEVRGYLKKVPIPVNKPPEDFSLAPFLGLGVLSINKYLEDLKQPYTGQIALKYGTIAKDLANYYYMSEQIPTVFNLSIKFNQGGEVIGAGGLFLQVMPDASDELKEGLEDIVSGLPSLGALIAENQEIKESISVFFQKYSPHFLSDYRIEFFCRCNTHLIAEYLGRLPLEELADIADTGPFPLEVRCHNCNTVYTYSKTEIRQLYNKRLP